jgi:hypothetical protein
MAGATEWNLEPIGVWSVEPGKLGAEWRPVRCVVSARRVTDVFRPRGPMGDAPRNGLVQHVHTPALRARGGPQAVRNHWKVENTRCAMSRLAKMPAGIRKEPGVCLPNCARWP